MEYFSILRDSSPAHEQSAASAASGPAVSEILSFPGNDGGSSLISIARRDLHAALQLLAERAQYITGASGAAIALRERDGMICRASAGSSAPELGAHLQVDSGLSGESVRTKKTLRCDNAETDARVNRDSCRVLGIASVVVMPLQREGTVNGVFELLSERPYAFEERDLNALERLGQMIQTAVEHAEAAQRADSGFADAAGSTVAAPPEVLPPPPLSVKPPAEMPLEKKSPEGKTDRDPAPPSPLANPALKVQPPVAGTQTDTPSPATPPVNKCSACGFPVSEGRTLCLDCEAKQPAGPKLFSDGLMETESSWLGSHLYLLATLIIALLTVAVIVLRH